MKQVLFVRMDDELHELLKAELVRARAAAPGRTISLASLVREMLYRAARQ